MGFRHVQAGRKKRITLPEGRESWRTMHADLILRRAGRFRTGNEQAQNQLIENLLLNLHYSPNVAIVPLKVLTPDYRGLFAWPVFGSAARGTD